MRKTIAGGLAHAADRRVQSRTIAAAGQDSDVLEHIFFILCIDCVNVLKYYIQGIKLGLDIQRDFSLPILKIIITQARSCNGGQWHLGPELLTFGLGNNLWRVGQVANLPLSGQISNPPHHLTNHLPDEGQWCELIKNTVELKSR